MQARIYEKGTNGLPLTTIARDLTGMIVDGEWSEGAWLGYLAARLSLSLSFPESSLAAKQWLGCLLEILNDQGDIVWQGLIRTITFGQGMRVRKRSLNGYANAIRCSYNRVSYAVTPPHDYGLAEVVVADPVGLALYGRIEAGLSIGQADSTTATLRATRFLNEKTKILYEPVQSGLQATAFLQLEASGLWDTLNYQAYTDSTAGTQECAVQVQAVLSSVAPFLSTDYSGLQTTGAVLARFTDQKRTALAYILYLLESANGYLFRIGKNGKAEIQPDGKSAGPVYFEDSTGIIRNSVGETMTPFDLRPGAILRQTDFPLTSSSATSAALDEIADLYLSSISWKWNGTATYMPTSPLAKGGSRF